MQTSRVSALSRGLYILAAVCLTISIFVPLWAIDLDAPQYPEGLRMLICPDGVKGDVEIINGLNHYIGMKTIHNEDFIEFRILPYLIGGFALLSLLAALLGRRPILYTVLVLFILFGILAMYDFWKWEYDYGHNLDPSAAIIVPGMAYQPPLIGFKQLLNFGAFSFPAPGGWLFITAGISMLTACLFESGMIRRFNRKPAAVLPVLLFLLSGCGDAKPEPIKLNRDRCDYCRMPVSNAHFGAELKTRKGRVYKFYDLSCLQGYIGEHPEHQNGYLFVHDYLANNQLIDARKAVYLTGEAFRSPMAGNTAAFRSKEASQALATQHGLTTITWQELQ